MNPYLLGIGILALVSLGVYFGLRWYLKRYSHLKILQPRRRGPETPKSLGVVYEEMYVYSEKKALRAWHVKASPEKDLRKTVLIFHNRNEAISDWVAVLRYLHDHGISSIIFDYRGFGGSEGDTDIATLKADAQAAFRTFMGRVSFLSDHYALGLGIGAGVMLEPATEYPNFLKGVVLITPYPSPKTGIRSAGRLDEWMLENLPGVFNARSDVARLSVPVLIVHSKDDATVAHEEVAAIHAAAAGPSRMVLLERFQHGDIHTGGLEAYLAPVVQFICEN